MKYKDLKIEINRAIRKKTEVSENKLKHLISYNPEYFEAYIIAASYYQSRKNYATAMSYFSLALTKELSSLEEREKIEKEIKKCKSKL